MAESFRYYFVDLVSPGGPSGVPNESWRGTRRIGGVVATDRHRAYGAAAAVYPRRPWEVFQITAARTDPQRREVTRLANQTAARARHFERLMEAICAGRTLSLEADR